MLEIAEGGDKGKEKGKGKKRSGADLMEKLAEKKRKAAEQEEAQKRWFDLKVNTSIYITGLPDDVDEGELAEVICSSREFLPCSSISPSISESLCYLYLAKSYLICGQLLV